MSDPSGSASSSSGAGKSAQPRPVLRAIRKVLYLALAAALAVVAYASYQTTQARTKLKNSQDKLVRNFGLTTPAPKHLAPEYSDKHGRLLADPPSDPKKLLDPDPLVLAYGEDTDLDVQPVDWEEFQKYLAEVTGKKVVAQAYNNRVNDVAEVKNGLIHVVALHAADTPYLVNNAGFIPVAVLGTADGALGNHLDLAVRTKSDIKTLADLGGRTLTSTSPTSITGHRAAVALLLQDADLRPDVDYSITYSLGQKRSILGLASGEYEVAALSDDKLQSMLAFGRVKPADFRIIYRSQVIPRLTIGYVYNLQPDLAAKVRAAILDFKNGRGPTEETTEQAMRFFAVDYKKDFEFVRKIDESFDPRLAPKPAKSKAASASAPASPPATQPGKE